jgi:hypothetical protein
MTNHHLALLEQAERLLRPLPYQVVFLGGASVSLHLDDQATRVRATKDVDFVVEATSYAENAIVEAKLRELGFTQDPLGDGPICRWHKDGLILDMMPTDPTIMGFGASQWFERGFESAKTYELPNKRLIRAFDALHLIAAKIEAFRDRGGDDWMTSRDVEDIVTVLDGRGSIFEELGEDGEVQKFIREWMSSFPEDELFEVLGTHLGDSARGGYLHEQLIKVVASAEHEEE